jgi:hypothetical protein
MKMLPWLPLLALIALGGCSDDDPTGQQQLYAHTRILNASPVTEHANARMFADDEQIGTAFQFGIPSACNSLTVPEGTRTISFRTVAGTVIAEAEHTFTSGVDYIIALLPSPGVANGARVMVFTEAYPSTVTASRNAVRIINGTASNGDVVFTTPTGAVTTGTARIALAAGESTSGATFREFLTTETRLRLFPTGASTNPTADYTLTAVPTERIVTTFLTGSTPARPLMGVQLNRCVH